ncbi:cyclase family protein [Glycomyces luteolus]|uniref:Cyclase family protein n=1 Tax=Glycomyces luteolus TaxID=2670330 RepID=A0A9X3P7I5_9ACTN|nr:cyclase family protein [Glycomyces luteolus]MDA1359544.1 cyclase family protein [Glycomyces luteolus]
MAESTRKLVELNHPITEGMTTYPGMPGPAITPYLTWEESKSHYEEGTEFSIGRIEMIANTGTYLDTPSHRYRDGYDLAGLDLAKVADVPATVINLSGAETRAIGPEALAAHVVGGTAVLLRTDWSRHWGTDAYLDTASAPFLSAEGAQYLVEAGAVLVGIDSVNIDDASGAGPRPAHTTLLGAGIPILEHLTGLERLPVTGARLHAAPPRIVGFGTFPTRAYAVIES